MHLSRVFKSTLSLLFLLSVASVQGQSLKQYVPSHSSVVLGVNWLKLEQKLSFSEINELDLGLNEDDPFMSLFIQILDNPQQYGLDLNEQTFYFHDKGDTFQNQVLLLALDNRGVFISKVEEWLKHQDEDAKFKRKGAIHSYALGKVAISCTNEMAIVLFGQQDRYHRYSSVEEAAEEDFNYWDERRLVISQIDSIRNSDSDPYAEMMEAHTEEMHEEYYEAEEAYDDEEIDDMDEAKPAFESYDEMEMVVEAVEDMEDATEAVEEYETEIDEAPEFEDFADEDEYYDEVEEVEDYDYAEIEVADDSYYDEDEYDYDYHPLMKALEERKEKVEALARKEQKKQQAVATLNEVSRYMNLEMDETNAQDTRFNKVMDNTHDLSLWVNPHLINLLYSRTMYRELLDRKSFRDTSLVRTESSFDRLMKDNFTYAFGDFNQGSFELTFIQERNKELQEFDYVKTEKVNSDMLNYLNEETFGYVAANLSVTDFFESYRKIMYSMIESSPVKTEVSASFEFMDIFINKDIFYNTFKGDGVFALTGVTTQIHTRNRYVYDEETFESEYKEVSDTSLFPKILCMAGIEKQENIDRLILAFDHLGIFKMVKPNVYEILEEPNGQSTLFYVAHQNGILFVTNDKTLVLNNLENGIPKENQLRGTGKDLLSQYGNCQYWDSQKSFDAILSMGVYPRAKMKGKIKVLQNRLSNGAMYSTRNGDILETRCSINFTDASINSLTELINLLHELEVE
jgi:hypothetical protein